VRVKSTEDVSHLQPEGEADFIEELPERRSS
jgi:hypothetical protein